MSEVSKEIESLKDKANDHLKKKDYLKAISYYEQALELAPKTSEDLSHIHHILYSNRSAVYMAIHEYQKAVLDAQQCVKLNPNWQKGYLRLATSYMSIENLDEALKTIETGLKVDNEVPTLDQLQRLKKLASLHKAYKKAGSSRFLIEQAKTKFNVEKTLEAATNSSDPEAIVKLASLAGPQLMQNSSVVMKQGVFSFFAKLLQSSNELFILIVALGFLCNYTSDPYNFVMMRRMMGLKVHLQAISRLLDIYQKDCEILEELLILLVNVGDEESVAGQVVSDNNIWTRVLNVYINTNMSKKTRKLARKVIYCLSFDEKGRRALAATNDDFTNTLIQDCCTLQLGDNEDLIYLAQNSLIYAPDGRISLYLSNKDMVQYIVTLIGRGDITAIGSFSNMIHRSDIRQVRKAISERLIINVVKQLMSNNQEACNICLEILNFFFKHLIELKEQLLSAHIDTVIQPLCSHRSSTINNFVKLFLEKIKIAKKDVPVIQPMCQYCKERSKDIKKCSVCKTTFYCSGECQKNDWPDHKLVCHQIRDNQRNDGDKVSRETKDTDRTLALQFLQEKSTLIEQLFSKKKLSRDRCLLYVDMRMVPVQMDCLSLAEFDKKVKGQPFEQMCKLAVDEKMKKRGDQCYIAVVIHENIAITFTMMIKDGSSGGLYEVD
ncbi:Hsp70-Hsp90 organizing protein [Acrasis kona]|uniref:Hsp70-Hsp90 organizing protein n=1 Tax=Acrasis kona TaxID=1008807 RepID=A0AAW2ZIR8_9EUKA